MTGGTKIRMDNGDQYVLSRVDFDTVLAQWNSAVRSGDCVLTISGDGEPRVSLAIDHIAAVIETIR
jgi:hypothetical protein